MREEARLDSVEGLMLKRGDSPYLAGRPKGYWWKWKRDPFLVDAVLVAPVTGREAWSVLTDFDAMSAFVPDLDASLRGLYPGAPVNGIDVDTVRCKKLLVIRRAGLQIQ